MRHEKNKIFFLINCLPRKYFSNYSILNVLVILPPPSSATLDKIGKKLKEGLSDKKLIRKWIDLLFFGIVSWSV